jgi:hypothetical protein
VTQSPAGPPGQPEVSRFRGRVAAGAGVALVAVGATSGVLGVIEATALVELGPLHLSVGALLAASVNLGFGCLAAWGLGSREAAALPGLGWFATLALLVFGPLPGGDVLVPGTGWDVIAFVVAGSLGTIIAILASPRRRPGR